MDCLTKTLAKLLHENENGKPDDAIEFIRMNLGDNLNDKNTIQSLKQDLEESQKTIEDLKMKLKAYETGGSSGEGGAATALNISTEEGVNPEAKAEEVSNAEWTVESGAKVEEKETESIPPPAEPEKEEEVKDNTAEKKEEAKVVEPPAAQTPADN